jgi:hypothetical protein
MHYTYSVCSKCTFSYLGTFQTIISDLIGMVKKVVELSEQYIITELVRYQMSYICNFVSNILHLMVWD